MNIFPKAFFFASLLSLLNIQVVWAEEPADPYMDALSKEAGKTSMKKDDKSAVAKKQQDEEEPQEKVNTEPSDENKLTDKVSQQLEKLLVGVSNGDIKQEDLANIVSDAVQAGHEIDSIHDAVTSAMTELREKEGINIKAEVLEFSIKAVDDIVGASKDIASGDVDDPYIQSLKAEAQVADTPAPAVKKETGSKTETASTSSSDTGKDKPSVDATVTVSDVGTEKKETAEKTTDENTTATNKPQDQDSTEKVATKTKPASEETTRTIIVLKGESLSRIAEKIYGSSRKYTILYEANQESLKDPNNIRVGQILKVPLLVE